ncbi:MAG: hypothetical protein HZA20_14495 [Nitrospirae bacterium]|jgi:hypothetical protein|nr:hypothetical protein [Nitrospirota bacterium]
MTMVNNNLAISPYNDYRLVEPQGERDTSRSGHRYGMASVSTPKTDIEKQFGKVNQDAASNRSRKERVSIMNQSPAPEYLLAYNRLGQGMTAISSRAGLGQTVDFFA